MLFTKVALVTCLFYLALNFLLEVLLFGLVQWAGILAGIHFHRGGQYIFFGLIWLVSFSFAWHMLVPAVHTAR